MGTTLIKNNTTIIQCLFVVFTIFCKHYGFCQISDYTLTSSGEFCKNGIQNNNKIYLIGEYHVQKLNFNIEFTFWQLLNQKGIFPKYNLREDGPSLCYLLNEYMKTGNEAIINILEFGDKSGISKKVRNYYLSLPDEKKFSFVGIDVDRDAYLTHYAIRNILLKSKEIITEHIDSIIRSFKLKKNPLAFSNKELEGDIKLLFKIMSNPDSIYVKKYSMNNYEYLKLIKRSWELNKEAGMYNLNKASQEFKTKREWFMVNNLYSLIKNDTNAVCFGSFGIHHVQLSNKEKSYNDFNDVSMAAILNNDTSFPLTNNKINSNVIVYSYLYPKHYKFFKTDEKEIKDCFKSMKENSLQFRQYTDPSFVTNLILLKAKK